MNKLAKYFLITSFLLSSFLATANGGNNWEVYYENAQVKISFCQLQCDFNNQFDQELIIFKIENFSAQAITVQWDSKIWYDNSCINCEQDSPEFRKVTRVEKGKTLEGNCSENNALRIFSKFTEKLEDMPGVDKIVKLTKFELENLNITDE